MAENQNVIDKPSFGAKVKEFFRKKTVALKRKPQTIPLVILLASTVYYMLILFVLSKAIYTCAMEQTVPAVGICTFVTTLLSLLVLVSFLNAFPRNKKPNVVMIAVVFVMIAAMVACDIAYYIQMNNCLASVDASSADWDPVKQGQPYIIVHVVLLAVSAVVFALLPVIRILVNKIDTSIKIESATENMKGGIDINED